MNKSEGKEKNILDSVMYNYSTNESAMEEENRLLRRTIDSLRLELERFRSTPLIVCEVRDIFSVKIFVFIINLDNLIFFYMCQT